MAYDVHKTSDTNENLPPLIIMHCMLGSKVNWKKVGSILAQNCNRRVRSQIGTKVKENFVTITEFQ